MSEPGTGPFREKMTIMNNKLRSDLRAEDGQGLVEYSLIILLVALVVVGTLGAFGAGVNTLYSTIIGSF